jgi:hypothetical protein
MKRIATVGSGLAFLVGVPLILVVFRLTIGRAFTLLEQSTALIDVSQIILSLAIVVLWLTWLWGTSAVVVDIIRSWDLRRSLPIGVVSNRASLLFVVALWSMLFAQQPPSANAQQAGVELAPPSSTKSPKSSHQHDPLPLALTASSLLVLAILARIEYLRLRQLRAAPGRVQMLPLSRRSRFTFENLINRAAVQGTVSMQQMIIQLQSSKHPPKIALMAADGRVQVLLAEPANVGGLLAYVPIGLSDGCVVLVALYRGTRFDIVASKAEYAESASRHIVAAAQLLAINPHCTVNIVRTNSSLINPEAITVGILQQSTSLDRLELTENGWVLLPTATPLRVFGVSEHESSAVDAIFFDVDRPLISTPPSAASVVKEWTICVRLLGPVGVHTKGGDDIKFEKSKALELLAWISTHRERPTRVAARTALWEMSVQDATFNNIVSDLRRGLARSMSDNDEMLLRTFSDKLALQDTVITDAEILHNAVDNAVSKMDASAILGLRSALMLVRDLPFAGSSYLWPDTEGITSNLVLTAITASVMLAEHYLLEDDIDGVFWATGQGLKVLRGHEELIALRMKAFAARGDFAGIASEWALYQRTVNRDRHFGAVVSPVLQQLHQGLVAQV